MQEVNGDKYMYFTYYVRSVGMKEMNDCKNAQCGKLQNDF